MKVPDTVISVIITNHNQLDATRLSIMTLLEYAPDVLFEIIVVDCGSTDGSDQFLTQLAENGAIRALFLREGTGRTSGRNQAAAAAFGRNLFFMDPGLLVGPGWWKSLVKCLDMDPRLGAISGRVLLPEGRLDHAGLAILNWQATETERPRLDARSIHAGRKGNARAAQRPLRVQAVTGEAIMTRATSFFSVGGFSSRIGRAHESGKPDYSGDPCGIDYCLRLGQQGDTVVYHPECIMTRLRPGEDRDSAEHDKDIAILSRTWLDEVRADFDIAAGGRTTPLENGVIRPYIEPMISFNDTHARGRTHPGGALSEPAASIIFDTRNDLEASRRALDALLKNTQTSNELLMLDSGKDPELNAYLVSVLERHPRAQLVLAGESVADNTNLALKMCRGRHVVLLGHRTMVTPGWLDSLIGVAEMNPEAGLVGPVTNLMNGMQQVPAVDYDTTTGDGLEAYATRLLLQQGSNATQTMRLSGFCLLIKRDLMSRIGGMDHRFDGGYYEFNDYSLRARMAGFQCLIARGCYVHQSSDDTFSLQDEERMMHLEIQWEMFKRKWNIPASVRLEAPLDLNSLLQGNFDPAIHFQAIGEMPDEEAMEIRERVKAAST